MKQLYVACSMGMYETPEYERYFSQIRADYPECEIIEPKKIYHSNEEWLKGWDKLQDSLDILIFFADTDGYIGKGVYLEIHSCGGLVLLLKNHRYIPLGGLSFSRVNKQNWKQYCIVTRSKKTYSPKRGEEYTTYMRKYMRKYRRKKKLETPPHE